MLFSALLKQTYDSSAVSHKKKKEKETLAGFKNQFQKHTDTFLRYSWFVVLIGAPLKRLYAGLLHLNPHFLWFI